MAALFRLENTLIKRLAQPVLLKSRAISTSKKNRDTAAIADDKTECATQAATQQKNWLSYGFDFKSESDDRFYTHSTFFFSITMCIVVGGFVWAYMPDYQLRDWAQREAYLEVRRRERAGLPLVDPNLVDPSKIQLPSDDELGDTEIII